MKIYNVTQGSTEWHALRARHHCASEAPVMMGASKKTSRTELVRMKATGDEKVFSEWVQTHLLDRGHEVEAQARAMIEEDLGEDLYPATIGDDQERFLASFDGITMSGEVGFEAKLWNEELAAAVRAEATELPGGHHWQLEHQLLANRDLQRIVFTCTDGTRDKTVKMVYKRVPGRAEALERGWAQFDEDVKNYVHVETVPKATATLRAGLPAVVIDVTGNVALESNLDKLGAALRFYVEAIPAKPTTDEDFANCEQAVKDLKTAEERLEAAEAAALARFESVEAMRTLVASMIDLARTTRLRTDRLVKDRKEAIRAEILASAKATFAEHVAKLNQRLGRPFMPVVPCDFAGAMRAKKTVAGLHDAVNVMLASGKIAANEIADRIQVNLTCLAELAKGYEGLFADLHELCLKTEEHFRLVVQSRIAEENNKRAAERERIRAEEEAKAVAKVEAQRPAPTPAPHAPPTQLRPAPRHTTRPRPTDAEIIAAMAQHFNAPQQDVVAWLSSFASTTFAA